ncbi:uncharacterized protein LOC126901436 [Daktulosphaira vitifoliae]|uniref:uncharacterized protein LOC126901436 n=1 Tax=Daktulosphaira vitifoliae TaxID=58002 RepID=UPI0021A97963|nr:uncharacterized protein LOC126901436 [Daktulosphaira vitifoliae]
MICRVSSIFTTVLAVVGSAVCVLFSEYLPDNGSNNFNNLSTLSASVKSCLIGSNAFIPCFNERAMAALERAESLDTLPLDQIFEVKMPLGDVEPAPRGIYSVNDDPYNIGAVFEAATSLLSRRTLSWDFSIIFPGLLMQVDPSCNNKGTVNFLLDPRHKYDKKSLTFGNIIFKRSLLQSVLATQISIVSLVPMIFATLYFLIKNALMMSKFAIVISSFVSYGSTYYNYQNQKSGPIFVPSFLSPHRDEKYYDNLNNFEQISSSNTVPLIKGPINYFPKDY